MFLRKTCFGICLPYNKVKTKTIYQFSQTECGIAALAIILSFYKCYVSLDQLRHQCGTSRDGNNMSTLIKAANTYGFVASAYQVELEDLKKLSEPIIAFWRFSHYIVIDGVGKNKVFINDPSCGRLKISFVEFNKSFTGIILVISPTQHSVVNKPKSIISSMLCKWLWQYRHTLFYLFLCLSIVTVCSILYAKITGVIIDFCIVRHNFYLFPYFIAMVLLINFFDISINLSKKFYQFKLITHASIMKSTQVLAHVLQLPMLYFSLRQKSEIIVLISQIESIIHSLAKNILSMIITSITLIACVILMIKINLILSLVSLSIAIVSCAIFYFFSNINIANENLKNTVSTKLYSYTLTSLSNLETFKCYSYQKSAMLKWRSRLYNKLRVMDKSFILQAILQMFTRLIELLYLNMILILGGYQFINHKISIGSLLCYYLLHLYFCANINMLYQTIKECQSAYVAHLRINDIELHKKDQRFIVKNKDNINDSYSPIICARQVSFSYNQDTLLYDITFDLEKGQHMALLGGTGSGKSTLAKLLSGLYQPTSGLIKIYNQNLVTLSAATISQMIAYVSEDGSLFSASLYDNLTMWRDNISPKLLDQAVYVACLDELINDRGLYTEINEFGGNFSGGERQRIHIARAIIQNTPILILDESMSALDNETRTQLITRLKELDKTIIFISHQLSAVEHCYPLYTLSRGCIIKHQNMLIS